MPGGINERVKKLLAEADHALSLARDVFDAIARKRLEKYALGLQHEAQKLQAEDGPAPQSQPVGD